MLYQFKGPFRITKLFRNAVHMENLDGSKVSSHSIDNVYPYSAKCNEVMEQFERRWLSVAELENSFDSLENKMIIVDLSDEHGPDFRVAKILRKMEDGNFEIHYYATRDKKASLGRRKFHPNWYEPNPKGPGHIEKCTADPSADAIWSTMLCPQRNAKPIRPQTDPVFFLR